MSSMRHGNITVDNLTQTANNYVVLGSFLTLPAANSVANGALCFNANNQTFQGMINGQWSPISSETIRPKFGSISAQTGTANLAQGSTAPTIASGAQILSVNYTPVYTTSAISIDIRFIADCSATCNFSIMLFRGSTLIGMGWASMDQFTAALTNTANQPTTCTLRVIDTPATTSQITYSVRFASTTGTWYVNQTAANTFGGAVVYPGNYVISEYF